MRRIPRQIVCKTTRKSRARLPRIAPDFSSSRKVMSITGLCMTYPRTPVKSGGLRKLRYVFHPGTWIFDSLDRGRAESYGYHLWDRRFTVDGREVVARNSGKQDASREI